MTNPNTWRPRWLPFAAIPLILAATAAAATDTIEEIIVSADLRGRAAGELPVSLSVLDSKTIEQLATQHFEELINVVPNLNWSGDGHRARYFQIRGVGELEQYQGAPNPSVGFLIDDIDFSGIGTIATLFDVDRVEVLRGPQGSRYGANALAGLIYVQSTLPTAERAGRLQLTAGEDGAFSAGIAFGGSLDADDRALFRLSAHHHQSNGFRDNAFLGRDDTNGRNETSVRGRLTLQAGEALDINIAALASRIDDGYDAFALDNSYTTLSDKPGKDAQDSVGVSIRADWHGWDSASLTSITAFANSEIEFSFDADWGNADSWSPFVYDYISSNDRERRTLSQEFRLLSSPGGASEWLVGVYALRLDDDLLTHNQGDYFDPFFVFSDSLDDTFGSGFEANSIAVFGQLEVPFGEATRVSAGLRFERRSTDYVDTAGLTIGPSDSMSGGELTLSHDHSATVTSYVSLSKGYKAGGFNLGAVPAGLREFSDEAMWNIEAGIKSTLLDERVAINLAVFRNERREQQVRTSFQLDPGDPASFGFATINAEESSTVGLEADLRWRIGDYWNVYASLGVLKTEFDEFRTLPALEQRAQAHAPEYTLAAGSSYRHSSGWFARIDATLKDAFYFDVSHDQRSESWALFNGRVGFDAGEWTAQLWAKNLFDERYAVRGFYFGNEPPNFPATLYTRLGDARQFGVSFDRRF